MYDYYLKFSNQAEAMSVLYHKEGVVQADAEVGIEANEGYDMPNFANIDIIGTIYNDDAVFSEDGEVISEATAKDGYHVNVRVVGEDASALEPFSVIPTQPRRIWG